MSQYKLDMIQYKKIARQAAAEGCVLLENRDKTLPLQKNDKIAIFGRCAVNYYKSGLGSGGLVNTEYVVNITDALKEEKDISVIKEVEDIYTEWIQKNPVDEGKGWGKVPWSQKEMPITEDVLAAAKNADVAVVVIGRTAGEDQDNHLKEGSYLLTQDERDMIRKVCQTFPRTAVLLNVGNCIDMKWVEELNPGAVLYVWQGGQEGGHGIADVLTGRVNPCGKLTDTIAKEISDYPSHANFGDLKQNVYKEDIYVGYRYFETFAKDKVLYPFGFGLSYTTFRIQTKQLNWEKAEIVVTNTGACAGREVVSLYLQAPQGKLGKPARVLAGFEKTKRLDPGECEYLSISIKPDYFASYDEAGASGHKSCFVLEEGVYAFFVGGDVESASFAGEIYHPFEVIQECEEACAPTKAFQKMRPKEMEDGTFSIAEEAVTCRSINPYERVRERREADLAYTGDRGYRLSDVAEGKIDLNTFTAQLSDENLIEIFRGEGMCSPKVTPGTGAAFGGLTGELRAFGIPALCCTDGPSGLRMDCGTKAFSLPNGTALGATFDLELNQKLYHMLGLELRKNRIDVLLGPGINIHRHPLNGRNFEYISEDPFVSGMIASAQLKGMESVGVYGTIKHFCANNQEAERRYAESIVAERALREIYLRSFEIAIKEGNAKSVMTTYGPVNGIYTAGSYDLCTIILRKEWGFKGIVMSDWWAEGNVEGEASSIKNHAPMVAAQNDLYMVTADTASNPEGDNVAEKLQEGVITRGELQRNAKNILEFALKSVAMLYERNLIEKEEIEEIEKEKQENKEQLEIVYYQADTKKGEIIIDGKNVTGKQGENITFGIDLTESGSTYEMIFTMHADLSPLAQLPLSVFYDNVLKETISVRGTQGKTIERKVLLEDIFGKNHYIKLYFGANGLVIEKIVLRLKLK